MSKESESQKLYLTRCSLCPKPVLQLSKRSKATKSGKTVTFDEDGCHILDESQKLIANAKSGKLILFKLCRQWSSCQPYIESSSVASKEVTWHK